MNGQLFPTDDACRHGRARTACPFCHTRTTDPQTSLDAARQAIGNSKLRQRIYDIHQNHPAGLTDNDLQSLLPDQHPGSVAKRRNDLTAAGLLADTGTRRPTTYGVDAIVWAVKGT